VKVLSGLGPGAAGAAALALLGACSVPTPSTVVFLDDLPKAQLRQIDAMPVLDDEQLAKTAHEELGEVESVSCKRSYFGPPATWEDAIQRIKYRALRLGGNAVAKLDCGNPRKKLFAEFCFESIHCTASAVRTR